ncbi:MAG: tetratricopeptide repeat protein [Phycisphaerales bacterium]|nr:tetratricopeptide repeat protein [Phycisphaerales bacterium]
MSQNPMDVLIGTSETSIRDPEDAKAHHEAGKEAEERYEREEAITHYRKAANADPDNAQYLFRLAYCLNLVGEEDEAISLYEKCCLSSPAPVNALLNLAVMYEDRGEFGLAEKCVRQVLDTNPLHERARLYWRDITASEHMFYDEEQERNLLKHNALLDTPVTDFELSVRARNCLKKMNIRTLGDLLRITEAELLGYKNFGETSLTEIKQMLSAKALHLGQGLEEQHRQIRREVFEKFKGTGKEGMLNKSVAEMELSVRARKALSMLTIRTYGDLASCTEAELMGVKNFGQTSLLEIKEKLGIVGLSLRELELG